MRFLPASKILAKALCVWATCSTLGLAQDFSSTLEQGPWISGKPLLNVTKPIAPETKVPFVEMMKEAFVRGLNNADHQREVLKMQTETGTKPKTFGEGYLGPRKNAPRYDANATHATRWSLFRNAKTFAGKEIRFDFIPESIKSGFRFDPTAPKAGKVVSTITGTPVRYGLILKDIEPADEQLRIASIGYEDDALYFQNAPKAKLQYDIGPIAITPVPQAYSYQAPAETVDTGFNWKKSLPDPRFRAKFSPRGAPTAAKPLPDQTMTLEQVQGYYSTEVKFANGLHKESLLHRFNVPLYNRFTVYEEYDETFKPVKVVLNDYLYYGPFGTNLEHYFLEKRYRAGFFYRKSLTSIELFANLPDNALNDQFRKQQRWELNVLAAF